MIKLILNKNTIQRLNKNKKINNMTGDLYLNF